MGPRDLRGHGELHLTWQWLWLIRGADPVTTQAVNLSQHLRCAALEAAAIHRDRHATTASQRSTG